MHFHSTLSRTLSLGLTAFLFAFFLCFWSLSFCVRCRVSLCHKSLSPARRNVTARAPRWAAPTLPLLLPLTLALALAPTRTPIPIPIFRLQQQLSVRAGANKHSSSALAKGAHCKLQKPKTPKHTHIHPQIYTQTELAKQTAATANCHPI